MVVVVVMVVMVVVVVMFVKVEIMVVCRGREAGGGACRVWLRGMALGWRVTMGLYIRW